MRLSTLFKQFLIVGSSSFGGYSALIAVVQRIFVEKKKLISESTIVEGFSLASILPGPVAVNTVTYLGFRLSSWSGALVSMLAVILPSMLFMLVLSVVYERIGLVPGINSFLKGVIPVIMALILSVIWRMAKNSFTHWVQFIVFAVTLFAQFVFSGYWVFVASIAFGAVVGYLILRPAGKISFNGSITIRWYHIIIIITLLLTLLLNFVNLSGQPILVKLFAVFSGVSLTLFGGGYVMIPMLEELIVGRYGWLSSTEFIDAIVLGQATPGPILISATFIGYKVAGFTGAILSTIAIFTPSALLITLIADLFGSKNGKFWAPITNGIKPVIIALMTYSIWILAKGFENYYFPIIVAAIAAILLIRYQVHFLWLILFAGIAGVLIF